LGTMKRMIYLTLTIEPPSPDCLRAVLVPLGSLPCLAQLFLCLPGADHTTLTLNLTNFLSEGALAVASLLWKMTHLRTLKLRGVPGMELEELAEGMAQVLDLEALDLDFIPETEISRWNAKELALALSKLDQISCLTLTFRDATFAAGCVVELVAGIRIAVQLEELQLHFRDGEFGNLDDDVVSSVCHAVQQLPKLRRLVLSFWRIGQAGATALSTSVAEIRPLQELTVNLPACGELDDAHFVNLAQAVAKHNTLTRLSFFLGLCSRLSDGGLRNFGGVLMDLVNLAAVDVHLRRCGRVSDAAFRDLVLGFLKLPLVDELAVNFYECDKLGEKLPVALQAMGPRLATLSVFRLGLWSCKKVENTVLKQWAGALGRLTNVRTLQITVAGSKGVSNPGVKELGAALEKLTSVEDLRCSFYSLAALSDVGAEAVTLALGELTKLHTLTIDFGHCTGVGDGALKGVTSSLVKLRGLRKLTLDFLSCARVGDDGARALAAVLQGKRLEKLDVNLQDTGVRCRTRRISLVELDAFQRSYIAM